MQSTTAPSETTIQQLADTYSIDRATSADVLVDAAYLDPVVLQQFGGYQPLASALQYLDSLKNPHLCIRSKEYPPRPDPNNPTEYIWGARGYFICSYRKAHVYVTRDIMPANLRNCYEMVHEHRPVNGYIDCDKAHGKAEREHPSNAGKDVDHAIAELYRCMQLLIDEARPEDGDWAFALKDATVNTSISDSDKKQSRHVVFHFPGMRMFETFEHAGAFFKDAVALSRKNNPDSPIFYTTKITDRTVGKDGPKVESVESMVDLGVYNKNRNMRFVGNCKSSPLNAVAKRPFLVPKCNHVECGGGEGGAACPYATRIPESLFLANSIMFVPLVNGAPASPVLLRWTPRYDEDAVQKRMHALIERAAVPQRLRVEHEDGGGERDDVKRMMRLTVAAIQREIGNIYTCSIKNKFENGTFSVTADNYKKCPYNGIKDEHIHNHCYFVVHLYYPTPTVFIKCLDPECIAAHGSDMFEKINIQPTQELSDTVHDMLMDHVFH
jgi:hypothetical protein